MKKKPMMFLLSRLAGLAVALLVLAGCTYPRLNNLDPVTAQARIKEPILLIPPLSSNNSTMKAMKYLGQSFHNAINNRVGNQVTYAATIESLDKSIMPENMITNGVVNSREAATIARTVGCNSVITIRVLDYKPYPPFRMVVELQWIDSQTGNTISRLYQIIDMTDSETDYRFRSYAGDGPARIAYEQFTYYKAISETAALKPTDFMDFVAAYSSKILFDQVEESHFNWRFWYLL